MGNRQSSEQYDTANTTNVAAGTSPPSATWLMGKMETTGVVHTSATAAANAVCGDRARQRLSSATAAVMTQCKPHSLSEATTMSSGESPPVLDHHHYTCQGSSDDDTASVGGSSLTRPRALENRIEDDHHDKKPRRSWVWQQLMGFVAAQRSGVLSSPCCSGEALLTTPPTSPHHSNNSSSSSSTAHSHALRKRRRSATSSLAVVDEKHRAFWELVQKLLAMNDVVAMIRELQDYLEDHVGATQCAVFLVDPNRNSMSRVVRGHETMSSIAQHRGLVGHAVATKLPLCRQLFAQDLNYDAEIDLPQQSIFQKLICVPLLENNNVYAVVEMTTNDAAREMEMDELDMKLLSWLGPILSSCMRKCIEYHDVLLSDRTQKALLHIISSSDTEDTVLNLVDGVIAGAYHITKSERLSLFMIDWETEELWTLSSSYHEETIRVPLDGSTLGYAARHRVTLNIADAQQDARFIGDLDQKRGIETRCALYVPVGVESGRNCDEHSRPMAVLEILNKEDETSFSLDDECAFEAFASEVAVILRRRSNEIEYIKLLADTRAEKVLAQRAKSQVNLLECFTEYVANANANHAADRLRHSFFKSHSRECMVCTGDLVDGTAKCTSIDRADVDDSTNEPAGLAISTTPPPLTVTVGPPPKQIPLWDFNIFATDADSLPVLVRDMFLDFRLPEILQCDEVTLRNFIFAVKETYHPNPFHNYLHAVSVVHMTYTVLKTTQAAKMLQPLDIAACLIAAYCHDVDHPGHTNSYEIVSKSPLAMLYSDESVLERHHASTTFKILLKDKNANILHNLSIPDFRYVRKMVVTAILSTDMAQHFKMCESMEKIIHPTPHHKSSNTMSLNAKRESVPPVVEACMGTSFANAALNHSASASSASTTASTSAERSTEIINVVREAVSQADGSGSTPSNSSTKTLAGRMLACSAPISESNPKQSSYQSSFNGTLEERTFLVKSIVHASDLCGQTFPKHVALKWSNMISKEFAYQALLEKAEQLPVSYQHLDDPLQMVEGQHFFAHKIVFPLWNLMHQMFPELEVTIKNLAENVAHYEHEIQRLKHHRQLSLESAAAGSSGGGGCGDASGGDGSQSDGSPTGGGDASLWCYSDDEGMAVPGLARCTPAKFNSFRALKSMSRSVSTSAIDDSVFGASAIEAIEFARSQSVFCRSRSSSTLSSESHADCQRDNDNEDDDEIFEISDLNTLTLLSGEIVKASR